MLTTHRYGFDIPPFHPMEKRLCLVTKVTCIRSPAGGEALPLTIHEAYDYMPVFSHDGKWLAFASDRYGNFDVYIMPASGGEAKRLTYHSATDLPYDFTPDGKYVLFGTNTQ